MHDSTQLLDPDVQAAPPEGNEQTAPSTLKWLLRRATPETWDLSQFGERTRGGPCDKPLLEFTLSSDDGPYIQTIPYDPFRHTRDKPLYLHQRVRIGGPERSITYVTLPDGIPASSVSAAVDSFIGADTHPFTDLDDKLVLQQGDVLDEQADPDDADIGPLNPDTCSMISPGRAVLTTIGSVLQVRRESTDTAQQTLDSLL